MFGGAAAATGGFAQGAKRIGFRIGLGFRVLRGHARTGKKVAGEIGCATIFAGHRGVFGINAQMGVAVLADESCVGMAFAHGNSFNRDGFIVARGAVAKIAKRKQKLVLAITDNELYNY